MVGAGSSGIQGIWNIWTNKGDGKRVTLFDIGDIVNIVASYADDQCLFKMSMINQKSRRFVVLDFSMRGKDRLIRVLRY